MVQCRFFIIDYKYHFISTAGVDFTKVCAPSEKMPAHGVWQKIRRSISSTNVQHDNPSLQGKFVLNSPNMCAICQICALFSKRRSPKNSFSSCASEQMLVKSTPGGNLALTRNSSSSSLSPSSLLVQLFNQT